MPNWSINRDDQNAGSPLSQTFGIIMVRTRRPHGVAHGCHTVYRMDYFTATTRRSLCHAIASQTKPSQTSTQQTRPNCKRPREVGMFTSQARTVQSCWLISSDIRSSIAPKMLQSGRLHGTMIQLKSASNHSCEAAAYAQLALQPGRPKCRPPVKLALSQDSRA